MDKGTANFLRLMNENNNAIAARKAEEQVLVGVDPIREKRDAERRERFGTLRVHKRNLIARQTPVRNVVGTDRS